MIFPPPVHRWLTHPALALTGAALGGLIEVWALARGRWSSRRWQAPRGTTQSGPSDGVAPGR